MENWVLVRKGAPFTEIAEKFHISPITARLIRNRNIVGDAAIEQYLNGTIADLQDGMLMKDMNKAVDILLEKMQDGKKIRVIGDYDIDGINATYILLEGLRKLGADVDTDIPDRMKDGYGLNRNLLDKAYEDGVDTIVTCDNGIAAKEQVAYGQELGMTIIITDHHEVPQELPIAAAVVDPKQEDCPYPFKELCGAAVAYKLVEALFEVTGQEIEDVDYLMENVAFATIGDVMSLIGENRIFVKQGLEMLRRTNRYGFRALMEVNEIQQEQVNAYHIGFVLGPCINATGRLDTAKRALELLCAKSYEEAVAIAMELKEMNGRRKEMTAEAVRKAKEIVEEGTIRDDKVYVIYLPDCHESLAGIVAGRIREAYYRPTIVLTKAEQGVKGSGRSIESYNMYEGLDRCRELFTAFGGHPMAAGLSLQEKDIPVLRRMLNKQAELTEKDLTPKVSIDMTLPFSMISEEQIEELELLEPFGKDNTKPLFAEKDIEILSGRLLGKEQNVLKFRLADASGRQMDGVYFGETTAFLEYLTGKYGKDTVLAMLGGKRTGMKVMLAYYPSVNVYMDRRYLQVIIQHYQ